MKLFLFFFLSFTSFLAHSSAGSPIDCSRDKRNTYYSDFLWFKASSYQVRSSVKNITGVLCVGFNKDKQLERVHYLDNEGNTVYKTLTQLKKRDTTFFSRSMMPGVVRSIMKSEHPLTIKIISSEKKYEYLVQVKFVENMMKGFQKARVRLIPMTLSFSSSKPVVSYRGIIFDDFKLNVSNTMKVQSLKFFERGQRVMWHKPSHFKLSRRN